MPAEYLETSPAGKQGSESAAQALDWAKGTKLRLDTTL